MATGSCGTPCLGTGTKNTPLTEFYPNPPIAPVETITPYLIETRLADWLPLCGLTTTAELEIINADLSTVTAAADRVLFVRDDPPWLLHLELVSSRDDDLLPEPAGL